MPLYHLCRCGTTIPETTTRCQRCAQADNQRRHHKQAAHGRNTSQWRNHTRPAVLDRDDHTCRLQLTGCTGQATTVHRLPQYGPHHDNNPDAYLAACRRCHGTIDGQRSRNRGGRETRK